MRRARLTRMFLWLSILAAGIGLGAKIFDLLVLAGAWGASPPSSLKLMPYGAAYPIDPGNFFQPLSAILLLAIAGALIGGWKTPWEYRVWLWLPLLMFILIWIFTPTVFWPMISELWGVGRGRIVESDAQVVQLVQRWVIYDWSRGRHCRSVLVIGPSDQRSFSWCAGKPQQLGVRYGKGYGRTTGRRDGLGAGG